MEHQPFRQFDISDSTLEGLERRGMKDAFPVQSMVLPDALEGHDVMVQSPTGSGKTLAFAIPIVERLHEDEPCPAAVVLVPTRELAVQVVEEFEHVVAGSPLRCQAVYGGVKIKGQAERAARAHIVVATPGRLEDVANRRMVNLDSVRILVLDEADRMLDMGFQPQVDRIVRRLPSQRQTMFFSATLDGRVGRLAHRYTFEPRRHEYTPPTRRVAEIEHRFVAVNRGSKVHTLAELLGDVVEGGLALVFVRTKHGADVLVRELKLDGVASAALHGDMSQAERERTLKRFEEGSLKVLIATDVAARGLDLDDITTVINYDPPNDRTDYTHRVGRTGRAGREGLAITLVQDDEQRIVGRIAKNLNLEQQYTDAGLKIMPPRMVYTTRSSRGSRLGPPRPGRRR